MLLVIVVAWVVLLPALVVGGLLTASKILGARARRTGAIDVTAFARELAALSFLPSDPQGSDGPQASVGLAPRKPVGAGY